MKKRGIFFKVFTYTAVFIVVLVSVTVALFSRQFLAFYSSAQLQQLNRSYQSLYGRLQGKSPDELVALAREFYENNQSFSFYIRDNENDILFSTPDIEPGIVPNSGNFRIIMTIDQRYTLCATDSGAHGAGYGDLAAKTLAALCGMLALGVAGAFIFARQMTEPIKRLAGDTEKMACLVDVPALPERLDELGDLARGVHAMYERLKDTISSLEGEVARSRAMEEAQRHFFSAASHELKTPVAAVCALLEGMAENVGDYKNHPKYLRECMRLMDAQAKTINEIMEIVNLNEGMIVPKPEVLDIGVAVGAVLPPLRALAVAGGQGIRVDIPEGQTCFADPKMLHRALSNVVQNAVQNTPRGGEIRIWSEPSAAGRCRICVLNTGARIGAGAGAGAAAGTGVGAAAGAGMGVGTVTGATVGAPVGTVNGFGADASMSGGLGLTIVKKTLDAMGATFSLANTDDGVLFWMDLPI